MSKIYQISLLENIYNLLLFHRLVCLFIFSTSQSQPLVVAVFVHPLLKQII
jgi:hypothetical protein